MHQNLLLRTDLSRPAREEALLELARDFEAGGFDERAAASYEELLSSQPRQLEAIERLIPLLQRQREFPRALALVKRLRRRDREKAEGLEIDLLLAQARFLAESGDQAGARQALKRCLRRDRGCGAAHALLGELEAEGALAGDQLFGGTGGDFLFGNIRQEIMVGESGDDFAAGDINIGR